MGKKMIGNLEDARKKICFLAPLPPPYGGIANWTAMICSHLDMELQDEIEYKVIDTSPKKRVTEGRGLFQRVFGGGVNMLKVKRQLVSIIKEQRPDCVHITTSGSLSLLRDYVIGRVLKKEKIPYVYHIHFGRTPQIMNDNTFEWKWMRRVVENASRVITIDQKTQMGLEERYGEKMQYIPNPIDLQKMPKPDYSLHYRVMFLGWVIKEKGIEELLEAWQELYPSHSEWQLDVVGPYKKEYFDWLISEYDISGVNFYGEKEHDEAMRMLNESDVFVLPSYTEGCPYVVLEAMALGKCIIASDVGNIPSMLENNAGVLVKSKDISDLKKSLNNIMQYPNDYRIIRENAWNKTYEIYSIDVITRSYRNIWNMAMGENE